MQIHFKQETDIDFAAYTKKYCGVTYDLMDTSSSNSQLMDYYKDEMVQQIASDSTEQNSLGLAQMLYEQMKRNYNLE